MKKNAVLCLLALAILLLSGCSAKKEEDGAAAAAAATPSPARAEAPLITGDGELADTARALMAPYQNSLTLAAQKSPVLLTHTIPGDVINKLVQDAAEVGAAPAEGRYRFTWRQSGEHSYSATAMQIEAIEAAAERTPDPRNTSDPVMDNQQMGDFSASGGGRFDRACAYDVEEHLQDGTVEITDELNGSMTGHEFFSFRVQDGSLYFVDATLDQAVDLDGLVATNRYLVAAGVLRIDGLDIMEFTVPGIEQIPSASPDAWRQMQTGAAPLTRLTVQGDQVKTTP